MSQAEQTIVVSFTSDGTPAFWMKIDEKDLVFNNGIASLTVSPGDHWLSWWLRGAGGLAYTIEIKSINLKIPKTLPKNGVTAGVRKFQI